MRGVPRRPAVLAAAAVLAATVSGCTTASPHPSAYRERTKLAIGDAVSHVVTAEKVLQAADDDKILQPYAITTARASDATLSTVVGAYAELYPPKGLDTLHTKATTLLGDASDLVAEARIAVYRGDEAAYPGLVSQLDTLSKKLEKFQGTLA
jgi:hypothetical protein